MIDWLPTLKRCLMKMALLTLLALLFAPVASCSVDEIKFIVNLENPVTEIDIKELVNLYEKKMTRWPDDTSVRFIDRELSTPERKIFLNRYLHRSETEVGLFWLDEKIHSGSSAPIKIQSDNLVLEMVSTFKGGIGYVSASKPIDREVKVIKILNQYAGDHVK